MDSEHGEIFGDDFSEVPPTAIPAESERLASRNITVRDRLLLEATALGYAEPHTVDSVISDPSTYYVDIARTLRTVVPNRDQRESVYEAAYQTLKEEFETAMSKLPEDVSGLAMRTPLEQSIERETLRLQDIAAADRQEGRRFRNIVRGRR